MRFINVKCLTGCLFRFDVIVIVYSIRFIAFTITSSFASLTGFPAPFSRSSATYGMLTHSWLLASRWFFARFKDLRFKDEKRTHTPAKNTPVVVHITIRADALNIASIVSLQCLIRICQPIPIINQRDILSKFHK